MDPGDAACHRRRPLRMPAAMGNPSSPPPPLSVAEVLGTGKITSNHVVDLLVRFQVTNAKGEALSIVLRSGWGLHVFLGILAADMYLEPGL